MKYFFTLLLFLSVQYAQAQLQLLMGGARLGVMAAGASSRHKKPVKPAAAAAKTDAPGETAAPAASAPGRYTMPFTYHGQTVVRKRTPEAAFKGQGAAEILALEALLEQSHAALLADSVHAFLPAAQVQAIGAADRKAVTARPNWNYAPYRQELAFYQKEEARRRLAASPAKTN